MLGLGTAAVGGIATFLLKKLQKPIVNRVLRQVPFFRGLPGVQKEKDNSEESPFSFLFKEEKKEQPKDSVFTEIIRFFGIGFITILKENFKGKAFRQNLLGSTRHGLSEILDFANALLNNVKYFAQTAIDNSEKASSVLADKLTGDRQECLSQLKEKELTNQQAQERLNEVSLILAETRIQMNYYEKSLNTCETQKNYLPVQMEQQLVDAQNKVQHYFQINQHSLRLLEEIVWASISNPNFVNMETKETKESLIRLSFMALRRSLQSDYTVRPDIQKMIDSYRKQSSIQKTS
jgi:hypothetical protein